MAGKALIKEKNAKIVKKFGQNPSDSGSTEVQVALLTDRINGLNRHFQKFAKDFHSKRGLLKLVGQRRRLLKYLRNSDEQKYLKLLESLELRK